MQFSSEHALKVERLIRDIVNDVEDSIIDQTVKEVIILFNMIATKGQNIQNENKIIARDNQYLRYKINSFQTRYNELKGKIQYMKNNIEKNQKKQKDTLYKLNLYLKNENKKKGKKTNKKR